MMRMAVRRAIGVGVRVDVIEMSGVFMPVLVGMVVAVIVRVVVGRPIAVGVLMIVRRRGLGLPNQPDAILRRRLQRLHAELAHLTTTTFCAHRIPREITLQPSAIGREKGCV
jgi:hypothetical protein